MTSFLILDMENGDRYVETAVNLETALHLTQIESGTEYEAYPILEDPEGNPVEWSGKKR